MNTPEKKFFARVYPLDRNLSKPWFIKYWVKDYTKGKLVPRQYKGAVNTFKTVDERLREAERIVKMIDEGLPLPNMQGVRKIVPPEVQKNFANTILVCRDVLERKKNEIQPHTLSCYKSKLKSLHQWLVDQGMGNLPVGQLNVAMANKFLAHLVSSGLKMQTRNNCKVILSGFWKVMQQDGMVLENPWHLAESKQSDSIPFRSHPVQVQKVIAENMPVYDSQLWLANQFIFGCFIRVVELTRVKLHMIDWEEQIIDLNKTVIRKKRAKARKALIPDYLFQQLLALKYEAMNPELFLFSKDGMPGAKPLSYHSLRNRFRDFRKAFNIPDIYKLYGQKHTGNRAVAKQGWNPQLQVIMNGHASSEQIDKHYNTGLNLSDVEELKRIAPQIGKEVEPLSNRK